MNYIKIKLLVCLVIITLSCSAQNAWVHYSQSNSPLPENSVRAIKFEADSTVWIGTDYGLAKLKDTTWTIYHTFNTNFGLPDENIRAITIDTNNIKWIGTLLGGLTRFDDTTWTSRSTLNSPLPDDFVRDVKFDHSGNTWIATTSGLAKIDTAQTWTIYNTLNSSFASDNIARIFIDPDNNDKIIGSVNGGVNIINDTTITTYTIANSGIPDNSLFDIDKDSNGNYWMASPSNGLIAKTPLAGWVVFNPSNSAIPTSGLTSLLITANGDTWIGSIDSGIIRKSAQNFTAWNAANSPLTNYIQCIARAPDGKLWIGTQTSGVYVMDIDLITAMQQIFAEQNIFAYPNPVIDQLYLTIPGKNDLHFELTDIAGRQQNNTVEKTAAEKYSINFSNLSAGIYLLSVFNSSGEHFTKKIVKAN